MASWHARSLGRVGWMDVVHCYRTPGDILTVTYCRVYSQTIYLSDLLFTNKMERKKKIEKTARAVANSSSSELKCDWCIGCQLNRLIRHCPLTIFVFACRYHYLHVVGKCLPWSALACCLHTLPLPPLLQFLSRK